jgi:hypothetical protein
MDQLKPGDLCTVVDCACLTEHGRTLIGMQCTLAMSAPLGSMRHPQHATFLVTLQDGSETVLCAPCLRRQKPPEARGDWQAIRELTGWDPLHRKKLSRPPARIR